MEATAARVGLPYDQVGAFCTQVVESWRMEEPVPTSSGAEWAGLVPICATRRQWGEAIWAEAHMTAECSDESGSVEDEPQYPLSLMSGSTGEPTPDDQVGSSLSLIHI